MLKADSMGKPSLQYIILAISMLTFSSGASADWLSTLNQYAGNIQVGLYALAGTVVLCCVIVSGIRLAISRMSGNHDKSFFDYIGDLSMAIWIGAASAIFTACWQVLGSSS